MSMGITFFWDLFSKALRNKGVPRGESGDLTIAVTGFEANTDESKQIWTRYKDKYNLGEFEAFYDAVYYDYCQQQFNGEARNEMWQAYLDAKRE